MQDDLYRPIFRNRAGRSTTRTMATIAVVFAATFLGVNVGHAYSILTHEQIVDLLWRDQIVR